MMTLAKRFLEFLTVLTSRAVSLMVGAGLLYWKFGDLMKNYDMMRKIKEKKGVKNEKFI